MDDLWFEIEARFRLIMREEMATALSSESLAGSVASLSGKLTGQNNGDTSKLLSSKEASEYLNNSPQTLWRYKKVKRIGHYQFGFAFCFRKESI